MSDKPLVSIPVLVYKNSHMIYDALDSIIGQDYPNMEIIISDDASDSFDRESILAYIKSKNRGNIRRVACNENSKNLGTVRHCNIALSLCNGEFIKFCSADNALYDCGAISSFVDFFHGTGALIVASQGYVYDEMLESVERKAMTDEQVDKLLTLTPRELFVSFIHHTFLFALGVCFSREFFDTYGVFDERYRIDEDRPMWLRITRSGCRIHYMDRVTVKFRSGGISHSHARSYEKSRIWYVEDLIKIWEQEVLPYRDLVGEPLWRQLLRDYLVQYEWSVTITPPEPERYF